MMIGRQLGFGALLLVIVVYSCLLSFAFSQSGGGDAAVMQLLKKSITKMGTLDWSDPDPCNWKHVQCDSEQRVTRIQIGNQNLEGTLPEDLKNLTALLRFEVMTNKFSGPLPSFSGLGSVQVLLLHSNAFSSIPSDFFSGMTSLQAVDISRNPFSEWQIPASLKDAVSLQNFSANEANIVGAIPDFLSGETFPALAQLHLASNALEGGLPASFSGSAIQSLWLNNNKQNSKMNGTIQVLKNMTQLKELWLHGNHFTGPVPDLSPLTWLSTLGLRDNDLTGIVPPSLAGLKSLQVVNLTNNHLQGSPPEFDKAVQVDMIKGSNRFCVDEPGAPCDPRVDILLSIAEAMGYPQRFAEGWEGNDPCDKTWSGISCSADNQIVVVNFPGMGLTGTISPNFSKLTSLQTLVLSNNKLTGIIPTELTALTSLKKLDVSYNDLHGDIPPFKQDLLSVKTEGNPNFGKKTVDDTPPGSPGSNQPPGDKSGDGKKSSSIGGIVGGTAGGVALLGLIGVSLCVYKRRTKHPARVQSPNTVVIHPRHSGDQEAVKITVASSSINGGGSETYSIGSSAPSDMHRVEAGNMVISIQVLRSVTDNFSEANILGRGGFGTVYKGELHDGTKIAVKRMESGTMTEKGLLEFKSEIAVLTKVRHRHLVALLGYCLDGNERLLVYEYMPQGTLSRFLFHWKEEDLKPLEWTRRLSIALDVARGVEYLHGLAHQSFIHRDLKPSNILLGDDMRAKVADFGLVRLAPEGKASFETRLAGTFGYLAPEYAVTGRVTTKVDVFAFGVILMEMITGRKALDETQPEESLHLVTWFRRMHINKDTFGKAIDPTFELDEGTLGSISTVAELAGHCCARDPYQRPDMGHVVNVLSSLVELWKPAEPDTEDIYGIDLEMTLPQALKKWQAFEGNSNVDDSSSYLASGDNTQTSIPTRPSGFADSFTSTDGR